MNTRTRRIALTAAAIGGAALLLAACSGMSSKRDLPPLDLASNVDLSRYAGTWHVIALIPTFIEQNAFDATETYRLDDDGTMATTFTYRIGSFDAPEKTLHSRGYPSEQNKAIWGQQFIWPIKADYRIAWLADDYSQTVVGRKQRDYVWIMARTPSIAEAELQQRIDFVAKQGYDISKLVRVPQRSTQ